MILSEISIKRPVLAIVEHGSRVDAQHAVDRGGHVGRRVATAGREGGVLVGRADDPPAA